MKNPFIPLDVENPSLAQMKQNTLKGPGDNVRIEMLGKTQDMWMDLMAGKEVNRELMVTYYAVR